MMTPARSLGLLALGLILGASIAAAWLGRYQVQLSSGNMVGFVTRLDRWSGMVEGQAIIPAQHQQWQNLIPITATFEEMSK